MRLISRALLALTLAEEAPVVIREHDDDGVDLLVLDGGFEGV